MQGTSTRHENRDTMTLKTATSAADIRRHLEELYVERELARCEGLADDPAYMADLEHDIAGSRSAYVGTAVTEIAILRGELSGRNQG
jgi:hypothetical protein